MLAPATLSRIAEVVAAHNPELIVVTDDVYGTFVPGFVSLMDVLPANTIAVYSFSKYFGATGWRLGVIAIHENNVLDRRLAGMNVAELEVLDRRYQSISTATAEIAFIDRMVADSRQVALNHTAGLSLPQQVQMVLFAAFALLDTDESYKMRTRSLVNRGDAPPAMRDIWFDFFTEQDEDVKFDCKINAGAPKVRDYMSVAPDQLPRALCRSGSDWSRTSSSSARHKGGSIRDGVILSLHSEKG